MIDPILELYARLADTTLIISTSIFKIFLLPIEFSHFYHSILVLPN
jgi:hypothetical protein